MILSLGQIGSNRLEVLSGLYWCIVGHPLIYIHCLKYLIMLLLDAHIPTLHFPPSLCGRSKFAPSAKSTVFRLWRGW